MFELDYLTQRLTFTRATDTTNPRLIARLRADVRGRGRRAAGRDRRAARRRARRLPRASSATAAGRSSTPRTACGPSPSPTSCSSRGRATRRTVGAACRALTPRPSDDVVRAPSHAHSLLGGSIELPVRAVRATSRPAASRRGSASPAPPGRWPSSAPARWACRWRPSSRRHGWSVIAVDVDPGVVDAINAGRSHVGEEPGLAELVADGPCRRPAAGDARRRRGGARGRRRRPDRAGHARRRAAARLPLHGCGGRRDRARAPRRLDSSSSRRRCRSATRASGSRRGSPRRPG